MRKNISNMWDRITRNNINQNFEELFNDVGNISGKITDEVYEEIKESVNFNWKKPVDSVSELPSNAELGDAIMIGGGEDYGKVYKYDGNSWVYVLKINADALIDLESKLQDEIDDKETPEGAQEKANKAEDNAKDYTDDLEKNIFSENSDVVRVEEKGSNSYGDFIRWSDGKQECFMEVSQVSNVSIGNIYRSETDRMTYPKEFTASKPIVVSCQVTSINRWASATTPRSDYVYVAQYSAVDSGSSSFKTLVHVTGWWK